MTSGEFRPPSLRTEQTPGDVAMTPSGLYRELRRIAYINQDFRKGYAGTFHINVEQGEPVTLADYKAGAIADWEVGEEWPRPRLVESYYFEGSRIEVGPTQNVLEFNYSYTNAFRGIHLPRHIAAYAFRGVTENGMPVDPVEAAGPSTIEHTLEFEIDSQGLDLTARETMAYYDHDGDQIAKSSSLIDSHDKEAMTVMPPTSLLEDDESQEVFDHNQDSSGLVDLDNLVDPRAPTSFYNDAADYLERVMGAPTLDDMRDTIRDFDIETRDLVLAHHVLASMKKAFRSQLGMQL